MLIKISVPFLLLITASTVVTAPVNPDLSVRSYPAAEARSFGDVGIECVCLPSLDHIHD